LFVCICCWLSLSFVVLPCVWYFVILSVLCHMRIGRVLPMLRMRCVRFLLGFSFLFSSCSNRVVCYLRVYRVFVVVCFLQKFYMLVLPITVYECAGAFEYG
jgi:hypothetical protein